MNPLFKQKLHNILILHFKFFILYFSLFLSVASSAQSVSQQLQTAWKQFENDPQLTHAISSLFVIDAKTGLPVFDKNSQIGLAPASTQKILTAVAAFDMLGKEYRYKTEFFYDGQIKDSVLTGSVYITSHGDPTLGSWRYTDSKVERITTSVINALKQSNIYRHNGSWIGVTGNFESYAIPDGWIWQDIGNYYGAPAGALNWNENQFDLVLKPGKKEGDMVNIIHTVPPIEVPFINELKTGAKNSGDNGYIYFIPGSHAYTVKGTIPCCVDSFIISGAVANSNTFTLEGFKSILHSYQFPDHLQAGPVNLIKELPQNANLKKFYTHTSPPLDSIIFWFLRKSINLYGEAILKTIAYEKKGAGYTDTGLQILKEFCKSQGVESGELNLYDGSGLSPLNRITTHAQVEILKYARKQIWFPSFYISLPEYNGIRLKSGTISDVKGFCGYVIAKNGKEYILSFLVNNYNGSTGSLVNKMYKVLDILK